MHISHWLALAVEAGELPVAVLGGSGETHVSGEAKMPLGRAGSGIESAIGGCAIQTSASGGQIAHCGAIVEVLR